MATPPRPDRTAARERLNTLWEQALSDSVSVARDDIRLLVASNQAAIRYCLPTQLLGKLVDHSLDALCLQRGDGSQGNWDPRGFAVAVIVPWNRDNQSVLGGSGDPYVSNPLRRPRIDTGLEQLSDIEQWIRLRDLLTAVQDADDPNFTEATFLDVLRALRDRLRELNFTYVLPARISIDQTGNLIRAFLADSSGGDRGLAVAAALFETLGKRLGLYASIRRGMINASDAAVGAAGDLDCLDAAGRIALSVEVKERRIDVADIHASLAKARAHLVTELLFCAEGIVSTERAEVAAAISAAWASGTNVYVVTIADFIPHVLPLLGERGIIDFVGNVGLQLDLYVTQPRHRKSWKALLDRL